RYSLVIPTASIRHDSGKAYVAPLPNPSFWPLLTIRSDHASSSAASRIRLFEGSRELGPPHTPHDDIRTDGAGAFSHWEGTLYFSTSDDRDPRNSGVAYVASGPATPSALLHLAGIVAMGVLVWFVSRAAGPDRTAKLRRGLGRLIAFLAARPRIAYRQ